jgi:hypothetical protein
METGGRDRDLRPAEGRDKRNARVSGHWGGTLDFKKKFKYYWCLKKYA